ncbi:MAG: hypothetical protein ABSE51_12465 [Terracidiphilus sp.]
MKRIAILVGFSLSLALTLPFGITAQAQNNQPTPQSPSAPADQPLSPPPLAPSDQAAPPSSFVQPAQSDESSSSAYQPPPSDSTPQSPAPAPVTQPDRFDKDHGEIEAFGDYLRFTPTGSTTNYVGVGGLAGFNVHPNLAIEAQMSYDFARNFTTYTTNGVTTTFSTTSVRPLTGLFGPKLQFGTSSPVRAFLTGKVGFIDFSTNTSGGISGGSFNGAVAGVGGSGTHFAVYPGGGIEMFAGWFGLRLEAGDEVYLNNGTYNNLRVAAGPVIRF